MCVDKTPDELGSFSELVAESEEMGQDWQIVLVAGLAGKDSCAPTSSEIEQSLKMMVEAVRNGSDLSRYMAFDRTGTPIHFE